MNETIKKLPILNLNIRADISMPPEDGDMVYEYAPFFNLKIKKPKNNKDLDYLRLGAKQAEIDISQAIDIDIERSYDGSANLVINDQLNPLKIINSRFYMIGDDKYKIADRKGNLDTNIYTAQNFKIETNLVKSVQSVVQLDFKGLMEGGNLPVGNYTFYFKLSDADGNETDFISESGRVICHIGNISQPKFIRGGQLNENSGKAVMFKLKNLDLAYNFINVYYTRTTGDSEQEVTTAYRIDHKYKINGINTDVTITGSEQVYDISIEDINVRYSEYRSVTSAENCQNISFSGGVTNDYELFELLEQYSLHITPELSNQKEIGNLSYDYIENCDKEEGYEYYNVNNIYNKLGYWDQEIYRIGIVYILNDYTVSPVFNIRGIDVLTEGYKFDISKNLSEPVNYHENFIIENTGGRHNAKGVFRIDSNKTMFNGNKSIKPIGIKFNFNSNIVDGGGLGPGLQDITRGFFMVRQKRIPTILAQAIGAASTNHGKFPTVKYGGKHVIETFLSDSGGKPALGSSLYLLESPKITNNVLLCPEAILRTEVYNSYFNSSEFTLIKSKYQIPNKIENGKIVTPEFKTSYSQKAHLYLDNLTKAVIPEDNVLDSKVKINTNLLLVEPGIKLIKNGSSTFSSQSGEAALGYEHMDVNFGDFTDPTNKIHFLKDYNKSHSKVRGYFNAFIGSDSSSIEDCVYYNIHQKDYDVDKWKDYFLMRYNDSSPYSPISDRITYSSLSSQEIEKPNGKKYILKTSEACYRGDCYINTFTHRLNWNFIDPELPTNNNVIDKYTWYKHVRVDNKASAAVDLDGKGLDTVLSYNKMLPMFTYKKGAYVSVGGESSDEDESKDTYIPDGFLTPERGGFKKYSERNGIFGYDKLNRPDVNAVGLGLWVTYKICSNVNLAMRDVDLNNPSEEALHGMKRSFYPLQSTDKKLKLPESRILNKGVSKTTGDKYYFEIPDVPFIKTNFPTRIHYSNILQRSSFVNGNRIFLAKNYQDYTNEYGALVKLVEWYGTLIAIMEHGILQIPVNERAMMKNEAGENVYINTDIVLPKNPKVLSNSFGSIWKDSVIKTSKYVYGLDTVGKKIWRTNGESFEILSDLSVQQFLNDNIKLKETDKKKTVGKYVIKTHYNAFKGDIMFTFKYGDTKWHLCWNELLEKWVTRYSWYPEFSENINNIFYTFANKEEYKNKQGILYKHGFAGTAEENGEILPTKWYDKQEPFEFEFIVAPQPGVQKIYNNFDIISNNVEPNSFIYEIVGDSYDWSHLKEAVDDINKDPINPDNANNVFNYMFNFPFGRLKNK